MKAIDGRIWSHFISPSCSSAKSYGLTLPLVSRMLGLGLVLDAGAWNWCDELFDEYAPYLAKQPYQLSS
jgi:hypothetical protein